MGWHLNRRSPFLWPLCEVLPPILLIQAWPGKSLSWRGNAMTSARSEDVELGRGAAG